MHRARNRVAQTLCFASFGIADPFAYDLSTGRGVVIGRAATKLRSIETQPLTGGSISYGSIASGNPCLIGAFVCLAFASHQQQHTQP